MVAAEYGPADLARAQRLAQQLEGGAYIWGGCTPQGSDCSGCMSILLNSVQGRPDVYVRRFSTGTIADTWQLLGLEPGMGDAGDFSLGVMYPWESSSGIGHTAGTLGSLNVESRGGRGVLVGPDARGATSPLFGHHFHLPISESEDPLAAFTEAQLRAMMNSEATKVLRAATRGDPDQPALGYFAPLASNVAAIRAAVGELTDDEAKVLAAFGQLADADAKILAAVADLQTGGPISPEQLAALQAALVAALPGYTVRIEPAQ